jgi:hypothetical protein
MSEFMDGSSFVDHETYLSDLLDRVSEEYREWVAGDGHAASVRALLVEIAATARCARRRFDADEESVDRMAAEVVELTPAGAIAEIDALPETGDSR